jgi:preprotein translocase subunit Sec63
LAKSTIRSLRVVSAPKVKPIKPSAQAGDFDPHEVLGVDPGADRTAVREAFHRLSMRYHPDRYTAADLPEEVVDYLEAMARRVNAAYELLSAAVTACERHRAHRTGPIYQKASTTARA